MDDVRTAETEHFPTVGARARAWARFERDLRAWLETPEGRFATWCARSGGEDARGREDRPV